MRMCRTLCILLAELSLLAPALGTAQSAVVKRNVNFRTGPSTSYSIIQLLRLGDELTLLEPGKTNNYYQVRSAHGDEGWVWGNNIRVLDEGAGPATAAAGPPEIFNGCGLEGNAQYPNRRILNRLKNRTTAPAAGEISSAITLAAMLAPGDDHNRWQTSQGAQITGYVVSVKPGAKETVNCGVSGIANTDAHIELALNATSTGKTQLVIVETTPRWRAFLAGQGTDWGTATLRTQLVGHCATFTGWMFFDDEHDDEAENTAPNRATNWRATAWEVHPVTGIQVVPCPN